MESTDGTNLWIKSEKVGKRFCKKEKTLHLCNVFIKDQPKLMKEETERISEESKKKGTAAQKTKKAQDETIMKNLPQNVEWIKQPYALSVMRGDLSLTQTHIMVELMGALQVKINDFIAHMGEEGNAVFKEMANKLTAQKEHSRFDCIRSRLIFARTVTARSDHASIGAGALSDRFAAK